MFKRIVVLGVLGAGAYWYWHKHDAPDFDPGKIGSFTATTSSTPAPASAAPANAEAAFRDHRSDVEVTLDGTVDRVLDDDTAGSPHQRFIVRLPSGQTVLVAHNIELAPRVKGLVAGSEVKVHGEYEWNDKGGVVHFTHKDPKGTHEPGWIEVGGKRYD